MIAMMITNAGRLFVRTSNDFSVTAGASWRLRQGKL